MSQTRYGSLPFLQAIRLFRGKLSVPTERWADVWGAQHDVAFMVAGAYKADLLADLRQAVDTAIGEGTTLQQFRKDFDAIVAKHGWTYRGTRAWRTRVIFETNLRTTYQAGRYAQLQAVKGSRPYWLYKHSDSVTHPRPLHASWDGLVLSADDPWWRSHYPPNGWGCKCRVCALSERDLSRRRKAGPDTAPDDGTREWVRPSNRRDAPGAERHRPRVGLCAGTLGGGAPAR